MPQERVLLTRDGIIDLDRYEYVSQHERDANLVALSADSVRALWFDLMGCKLGYLSTEETIAELENENELLSAAFSRDGTRIGATFNNPATERAELKVWDAQFGTPLWSSARFDRDSSPQVFAFSHDGRHLAYPFGNGTVRIVRIPLPPPQPE